jgi:hypothetical protein
MDCGQYRRSKHVRHSVLENERGALAAELSVTVFLFLSVIFSLMTLALFVFHQATLQFVVNRGIRMATIGDVVESGSRIKATPASVTKIETALQNLAREYGFTLTPPQIRICSAAPGAADICDVTSSEIILCPPVQSLCATESSGNPGDMVMVSATTTYQLLGLFPVTTSASAIGRIETSQ